jgi:hypothetical protein
LIAVAPVVANEEIGLGRNKSVRSGTDCAHWIVTLGRPSTFDLSHRQVLSGHPSVRVHQDDFDGSGPAGRFVGRSGVVWPGWGFENGIYSDLGLPRFGWSGAGQQLLDTAEGSFYSA